MPVPAWIANLLMRFNIAVISSIAPSAVWIAYGVVGIAYRWSRPLIWEVIRVVMAKPAALSAAELIFSRSIVVPSRSPGLVHFIVPARSTRYIRIYDSHFDSSPIKLMGFTTPYLSPEWLGGASSTVSSPYGLARSVPK